MSSKRAEWEYADGPEVGRDVPVTSEPREEDASGSPQPPPQPEDRQEELEEREVKVADPGLDALANQRLTEEVQEVLGTDRVRVRKDRPRPSRGERPRNHGLLIEMSSHRLTIVMLFAAFFTIGAVVSLSTGDWWLLPVALGVHALGTVVVTATALHLTTISEHASPTTAAMLQEEGVRNPDEHFARIVEEFSEPEHGDASAVVSPKDTPRTATAAEDPGRAAAEQSSAMTPSAGASEPIDGGGAPEALMWSTVVALLAVSLIIPVASGGGAMWILPVVMVPLLVAWVLIQGVWKRPK
jgi:protein-tyrosine-phosphatase